MMCVNFTRGDDSDRSDVEPGDPHFDLLKSRFQLLLELNEEPLRFGRARRIDENANDFITVNLAAILPLATDDLCFERHGTVARAQFAQRVADHLVGDGGSVIKPLRKQDLESA